MNKLSVRALVISSLLTVPAIASADTAQGSLQVSGTVQSSMTMVITSGAATVGGSGSAAASFDFGSIAKYNATAPTGWTLVPGSKDTNWKLQSSINIEVDKANLDSASYSLGAKLRSAPDTGVSWKVAGQSVSDADFTQIAGTASYSSPQEQALEVTVQDSAASGASLANYIDFLATSN